MKIFYYPILFLCLLSCKSDVNSVYNNRNFIMNFCKNKALIKGRDSNLVVFKTFRGKKINEYYLDLEGGKFLLYRSTIQYTPDILGFKSRFGTKEYKMEVCKSVELINAKMKSFGVTSFRTDFVNLGIPLTLYMMNGKRIVYIPDLNRTPKDHEYRESLEKLGDSWYYID